jgi:hypothetical protein
MQSNILLSRDDCEELHEIRLYLEKCLANQECTKEYSEFLKKVASFKKESFKDLKEKLTESYADLIDFCQILNQVEIQVKQTAASLQDGILRAQQLRKNKTGYEYTNNEEELSFEEKLMLEVFAGISEQLIDSHNILIRVVEKSWDYFPVDLQEALEKWVGKNELTYHQVLQKIFKEYKVSWENQKTVVSNVIKQSKSTPKFRNFKFHEFITGEKSSQDTCSENTLSDETCSNIEYTLEELVEKITPDNQHEETDWGRAVGQEIW